MAYSYREVLKEPRALGVFGAALLGRLSFAMGPLSLVLFVRAATGSFAVAGAASAATALTSGLFAPVRGRMVDRYGQPRTLPPLSLLYAAAFVGVLLLASAGRAGEAAAVLLSGVAGAAAPPLAASMRVLWSALVGGGPRLQTAFALDTVVEGVLFTLGPLLASGLAAAFAPAAALAAVAALAVVGTLAFISSPVSKGWIPTVGIQPFETGLEMKASVPTTASAATAASAAAGAKAAASPLASSGPSVKRTPSTTVSSANAVWSLGPPPTSALQSTRIEAASGGAAAPATPDSSTAAASPALPALASRSTPTNAAA